MEQKYVLFGAGLTGRAAVNYFDKNNLVAVIDNYIGKIGTLFEGIPVISFEDYLKKYNGLQVIISIYSKRYLEAKKQLEEAGIYDYFTAPPVIYGLPLPEELGKSLLEKNPKKLFFYGINPISNRMVKWLKENSSIECLYTKTIKECENIDAIFENISENDMLVITTNEVEDHIREKLKSRFYGKVFDIYTKQTPTHKELAVYKDMHKGKRCFVIGNGPSLCAEDLDKLKCSGEITFASNNIFYIYNQTQWRPSYYVATDIDDRMKDYIKTNGDDSFFITAYSYCNDFKFDNVNHISMINKINEDFNISFSDDITVGVVSGKTVTYVMLQIASYMGFSEIYLLGVDFSWGENGGNTHFCKEYHTTDKDMCYRTQDIQNKDEIYKAYLCARKFAEKNDIKIYNATRGGKLEAFERVDFDSLFDNNEE